MIAGLPMGFLMARRAEGDHIFCNVIAQLTPSLNVMDLKILHPPARLTPPPVSLQNFPAELAIGLRVELWAGPRGSDPFQSVPCASLMSCLRCGFGRATTSRVR